MKIGGKKKIISQAKTFFCFPWVLTERVTYQIFSCSQKNFYVDDKNEAYTEEFIKFAVLLKNELMNRLRIEDDDLTINEDEVRFVLDKYSIPFPRFSLHWLGCFMIRNRLSWRKAYYLRRGSIDETYVDLYLQELAQAIIKFGYDRVFNMDENAVRVNNGSVLTFQRACFSKVSNLISENLS